MTRLRNPIFYNVYCLCVFLSESHRISSLEYHIPLAPIGAKNEMLLTAEDQGQHCS